MDIRSALSAGSPLLLGLSSDVLGRTRGAALQGLGVMQQQQAQKAEDEKYRRALQMMKLLPPDPKPGQVSSAPLAAPNSPMSPAQALAAAGMHREAFGMATQPGADPYSRYKVAGGALIDLAADGGPKPVYEGGGGAKAQSALAKLAMDYKNGLIDRETFDKARAKALRDPNGITIGPDGTVQIGGSGPIKLTEHQAKFTLFGNMMKSTMPVINELEAQFDPSNLPDNIAARAGAVGEFFKSDDYQKYEAAAQAWAEGVLRLQTGAAAQQQEIDRVVRTYFAQPGNSAETIAYKRKLRDEYARAVMEASGGLVDPLAGPVQPPATGGQQTPDFSKMDDATLEAWIRENGG